MNSLEYNQETDTTKVEPIISNHLYKTFSDDNIFILKLMKNIHKFQLKN